MWRIAADSERFRAVWRDDRRMMTTWFQGTGDEFIAISRAGPDRRQHPAFLGGTLQTSRAAAPSPSPVTISQRALVHGVLVDVVRTGQFYDFLEKRDGRWGVVLRQPIYEKPA